VPQTSEGMQNNGHENWKLMAWYGSDSVSYPVDVPGSRNYIGVKFRIAQILARTVIWLLTGRRPRLNTPEQSTLFSCVYQRQASKKVESKISRTRTPNSKRRSDFRTVIRNLSSLPVPLLWTSITALETPWNQVHAAAERRVSETLRANPIAC